MSCMGDAGGRERPPEPPRLRPAAAPGSISAQASSSIRRRLPHVGSVTALVPCPVRHLPLLLSTGFDGGVRLSHSASLQEVAYLEPFDAGCCSADWSPHKASMMVVCSGHCFHDAVFMMICSLVSRPNHKGIGVAWLIECCIFDAANVKCLVQMYRQLCLQQTLVKL
jgi:hypothetical protein